MITVLAAALQLLAPPTGMPAPTLKLIHIDATAAVHADVAEGAGPGRLALVTAFDTRTEPYWLWIETDCSARVARTIWRQTAVELMDGRRRTLSGVPRPLDAEGPAPAVGRQVCDGVTDFPETSTTADPDAAMSEAYNLPALVRERPDLYARTGDLGEFLEFLGADAEAVGWFVDDRTARDLDGEAEIQTLRITGRSFADAPGARYVWSRMRFDCATLRGRVGQAFLYDEAHQPVGLPHAEAELPTFVPQSALDRVRQFACSPGAPPESQTVAGLGPALIGIRDHFAPGGPGDREPERP